MLCLLSGRAFSACAWRRSDKEIDRMTYLLRLLEWSRRRPQFIRSVGGGVKTMTVQTGNSHLLRVSFDFEGSGSGRFWKAFHFHDLDLRGIPFWRDFKVIRLKVRHSISGFPLSSLFIVLPFRNVTLFSIYLKQEHITKPTNQPKRVFPAESYGNEFEFSISHFVQSDLKAACLPEEPILSIRACTCCNLHIGGTHLPSSRPWSTLLTTPSHVTGWGPELAPKAHDAASSSVGGVIDWLWTIVAGRCCDADVCKFKASRGRKQHIILLEEIWGPSKDEIRNCTVNLAIVFINFLLKLNLWLKSYDFFTNFYYSIYFFV